MVIPGVPNSGRERFQPRACVLTQPLCMNVFSEVITWRLDEAANLPRFRPLDVGPVGFTGRSYKSNFLLLPNIGLTRFRASRGFFWRFVRNFETEAFTFRVLLNFED